jgi:hypothetical protein
MDLLHIEPLPRPYNSMPSTTSGTIKTPGRRPGTSRPTTPGNR